MDTTSAGTPAPLLQRVLLVTVGLTLLNAALLSYFVYQQPTWQLWANVLVDLMCAGGTWLALREIQRGRPRLGAQAFLGIATLTVLATVLLIKDMGLLLGVALVLLTTFVSEQALPGRLAQRALNINVVISFLVLVLDLFWPGERFIVPAWFLFGPLLLAILSYGFYVFRQFRSYSFRTKLVVAFLSITVGSISVVAFTAQYLIRTQLTQQVGANLKAVATAEATNIGDLLAKQVDALQIFAFNLGQRTDLPSQNATYPAEAATVQAELLRLDAQWRAADAAGNDFEALVRAVLIHPLAQELRTYQTLVPDNVEVFVTDRYGGNVAATNRTSDYYQADEPWWQAAYAQGRGAVFIGQPAYDESSRTLAIIIAVPVYLAGTPEVIGILRTTYRLTALTAALTQTTVGSSRGAGLWLPEGRIYTAAGDFIEPAATILANLNNAQQLPYGEFTYTHGPSLVGQALVAPNQSVDPSDKAAIMALGWRVVHDATLAEALSLATATERFLLILGLLIVVGVWFAAQFVAQQLAAPIVRLTATANQIVAGRLEVQAPVETQDEIGILAKTFNTMTAQLRLTLEDLKGHMADLAQATTIAQTAQAEAEAANQAKSTFLANMSHELRTPLTVIVGYAEMLQEAFQEQQPRHLAKIERIHLSANHLLGLINDILDFSKIEAGRLELNTETFALAPLLEEVVASTQPLLTKNANTLQVELADNLGKIQTDPTRLRQVLLNLLSNAAKFTAQGLITLHVERETLTAGEAWLLFRVKDTGIGLTDAQLSQLFQPFKQADPSTTRKYGGTGLGLVISRRLCQMLGGDILVASQPGVGSTFTVRLPAAPPAPLTRDDSVPLLKAEHFAGQRVLIIDDDFAARQALTHHLERAGFNVESVSNGFSGLERARQHPPDLITLDILMPEMDGWEVLKQLKADPVLQHIPVIILTLLEDQQRSFSLGAADYLLKPINRQQVLRVLAKYQKPQPHQPSHILIVEDEPAVRAMLSDLLTSASGWRNLQLYTAANGREGLEQLAQQPVDLIVLDLMMPEMDGFQFLAAMRQNAAWRQVPVVVVTAMELTPEQRQQLNGQVTQVLQKSHQAQYLAEVVQEISAALARPT